MVRITCSTDRCYLKVLGHAGAGPKGADPVCAGISALVMTLGENMLALEGEGILTLHALGAQSGAAVIWAEPKKGQEQRVRTVFQTVERGIRRIARQYPGYVRLR